MQTIFALGIISLFLAFFNCICKLASPITVNTNVTNLTDREIALSYFLTLKRAGKEYTIASMEATNPKLRQFIVATGEQTGNIAGIYNTIPM